MKRSNLAQTAVVLGAAAVVILFVLRERLADWVAPPYVEAAPARADEEDPWVYVCPMDGFQRKDPGPCLVPSCGGMPLTEEHRVRRSQLNRAREISLSSDTIRTIGLATEPVEERELVRRLRALGRVAADERLTRQISARVEGRLEHVYKNFVGAEVRAGEPLAEVYSPAAVAAQEELLIALRRNDPGAAEAARRRLLLWGFTEAEIRDVEKEGKPRLRLTFPAPLSGVVSEISVHHGHWVKEGDPLMNVVDLSSVWVKADVYEPDVPFVHTGQRVEIASPAHPGEVFRGTVSYVHAFLDEKARTLHLRVDVPNPERRLLPGMYVEALLLAPLGPGGTPLGPEGLAEVDEHFCHAHGPAPGPGTCPTCGAELDVRKARKPVAKERTVWVCGECCPDVREDKPGKCPKCPMPLKEKKELAPPRSPAVPRSAVLDGGLKRWVFVEVGPGAYRRTEVELGPLAGDYFPVRRGLKKGDRVVTRAAYLLDSQSQITTGASALYGGATEVKEAAPGGHRHH